MKFNGNIVWRTNWWLPNFPAEFTKKKKQKKSSRAKNFWEYFGNVRNDAQIILRQFINFPHFGCFDKLLSYSHLYKPTHKDLCWRFILINFLLPRWGYKMMFNTECQQSNLKSYLQTFLFLPFNWRNSFLCDVVPTQFCISHTLNSYKFKKHQSYS